MAGQRYLKIGIDNANLVPCHIVGSYRSHSPVGEPGGCLCVHPSRLQIHARVMPERAIARAQQHNITLIYRESLVLSRSFHFVAPNRISRPYMVNSPLTRNLKPDSASNQWTNSL